MVFHLAGAVSRDPDDAQRMMRLHVDGTRRVLEHMASSGVRDEDSIGQHGRMRISGSRGKADTLHHGQVHEIVSE